MTAIRKATERFVNRARYSGWRDFVSSRDNPAGVEAL
jgi:hypothetical protein